MNAPRFVDDISIQGAHYAVLIRSPAARGRIVDLQCPEMPNSYALITAADIPGLNRLADFPVPVLAADTLSYIGQPVGILTGFDMRDLETYAAKCRVVYEELPPAFPPGGIGPERLLAERRAVLGSAGEQAAAQTIHGVYKTGIQEHWYTEPHGAVAIPAQDRLLSDKRPEENPFPNKMLLHTATLWPSHVKRSVCQVLDIPPAALVVKPSLIGLHLDGKLWYPSLIACHAALAAHLLSRPVKLMLTREEDFRYSPKRAAACISLTSGLDAHEQLAHTAVTICADLGAQGVFTDELLDTNCLGALGVYSWPSLNLNAHAFSSSLPPQGPFAGFGLAQGFFAVERHVSRLADALKQDPAVWRKEHAFDGRPLIGTLDSEDRSPPPIAELIDNAAAQSGYYRKWASYELLRQKRRGADWTVRGEVLRGVGIAAAYQGNGFLHPQRGAGPAAVELVLGEDSLEIRSGLVFSALSRESAHERCRNIAARMLSLPEDQIRFSEDHTDVAPDSGPAACSQNTACLTGLIEAACADLKEQRARHPAGFPFRTRQEYQPVYIPSWGGAGAFIDGRAFASLSWAAAVVEISIDQVSYVPKIRGVWLAVEAGRIFSMEQAGLALRTSTIHALGWACREELSYEQGALPENRLASYDLPAIAELPPIRVDFLKRNTSQCKGLGELPFNCVPAAYVQAVSQAMDHPFTRIPLTPSDLLL
jgi:CO/xanthine dehydrogenase Mo-binding subunit